MRTLAGTYRPLMLFLSLAWLAPGVALADKASAHYHQAMAHKQAGRMSDAIRSLKEALQERDDYAAAHYSICILYRKKKNYDKAITHCERATQLQSDNGEAHYSLGLAYYQAGRKDDALRTLRKAADLLPKDARVQAQVGVMMIRRDPEAAIKILKRVVKLKPNTGDHLHQLGLAYRKATTKMTGKHNDQRRMKYLWTAKAYMTKALGKKSNDAKLHFDLGAVYRRLEKTDEAIKHYERAVEIAPAMAPAHWDLAHMYTQAKRFDEAISSYKRYQSLVGDRPDAKIAGKRIEELKKRK